MSGNGNLSYGLNSRNKRKKGGLTGFGGDDSDDSNSDGGGGVTAGGARSAINRDIAAEQAALRKRAKAAMANAAVDSNVYDYDAEYDSFSSGKKKEDEARSAAAAAKKAREARQNEPKAKVQPRYITNLLKTAQRRNQEQEIIYEKKVQKEQAEEDANEQYEGKDKFITSSYKRKLAEREQWAKEEAERSKREAEEDVTKKSKGVGSFMFGGIGRSMLMGSGGGGNEKNDDGDERRGNVGGDNNDYAYNKRADDNGRSGNDSYQDDYQHRESSRETERWGNRSRDSRDQYSDQKRPPPPRFAGNNDTVANNNESNKPRSAVKTRQQILAEREIKIREARERYFKRRGIESQ